MGIINLETLQIIDTSFSAAFKKGLNRRVEPLDLIASTVPSSTRSNTYAWLGDLPDLRKWVGDRIVKGVGAKSYQIVNAPYELTIGVDRDDIEDDQWGIHTLKAEDLGAKAKRHPSKLAYRALKAGGDADALCYDGLPFFSNAHPVGDGTASNDLGGGGDAWYLIDDGQVLKPIIFQDRKKPELVAKTKLEDDNVFWAKQYIWGVDYRGAVGYGLWQTAVRSKQTLNETNLALAAKAMREFTDDTGEPLDVMPTLLVVPPSLEITALKLLEQQALSTGETNIMRGRYKLHVSNYVA